MAMVRLRRVMVKRVMVRVRVMVKRAMEKRVIVSMEMTRMRVIILLVMVLTYSSFTWRPSLKKESSIGSRSTGGLVMLVSLVTLALTSASEADDVDCRCFSNGDTVIVSSNVSVAF